MGYVSIPTDISGKMDKVPDYDSGCFSLTSGSFVSKTHNLNTCDLLVKIYYGANDTDCINDGINGTGRPIYYMWNTADTLNVYSASINIIELNNITVATKYFRILIWKGV